MALQRKLMTISLIVAFTFGVTAVVSAQSGIPGSGWWSGANVQNVGTVTGTVSMTAYESTNTSTYVQSATIASGASFNFQPATFPSLPSGFVGSAIVSSDQPIKAIVNVTNAQSGSLGVAGGKAAAQYQGTENPSTTLYFPLAKNNRFTRTTAYYLQNAGSAPATINVTFNMDNGASYPHTTASVGPGDMVLVLPDDAGVPASPSDGTRVNIGSMTATSTQALAATMLEFIEGETVATVLNGSRGFTSADFDTTVYAPITKNNRNNRFTGMQIFNVSGSPITATITYVGSANVVTCKDVSFVDTVTNIMPGTSKTINQQAGSSALIANCTAAATITAGGQFVALVNEANAITGTPAGITYAGRPANGATTSLSAPQFKDQRFGFSSGFQLQNVGVTTATVTVTFSCRGNGGTNTPFTAITNPQSIGSGKAMNFFKPSSLQAGLFTVGNPFSINNAICGILVASTQPVVGVVNETPDTTGALDDNNYEGFNLTP